MRNTVLGALTAGLGVWLCLDAVRAEVPELDDGARRVRASLLERRATEWLKINTRVLKECQRCRGTGKVQQTRACPSCGGAKRLVDGRLYMQVHHAFHSPAYRAQDGVEAEVEARWRRFPPHGRTPPARIAFLEEFELVDVTLTDATHGVVRAWTNRELTRPRNPKTFHWIWAEERPGQPGRWYVHDRMADGPWPHSGALEPYDGATEIGQGALQAIGADWPDLARHRLVRVHRKEGEMIVTLVGRDGVAWSELRADLGREALDVFGRIFTHTGRWKRASLVAAGRWTNELGAIDVKPYAVLGITREDWESLQPESLQGHALLRALGEQPLTYWGWTRTR